MKAPEESSRNKKISLKGKKKEVKVKCACGECGKAVLKSYLARHVAVVHKKERRVQCEICHKKMVQYEIPRHMRMVHKKHVIRKVGSMPSDKVKCEHCSKMMKRDGRRERLQNYCISINLLILGFQF